MAANKIVHIEKLMGLIPQLERESFGRWSDTSGHAGTSDDPIPMPYVIYEDGIDSALIDRIYEVVDSNPELGLTDYTGILEANGLEWSDESLASASVSNYDPVCVLAMLVSIVRADRFSEGTLLRYLEDGHILRWIKRLEECNNSMQ